MPILFFWRGDNYQADTNAGRPSGDLVLHQNSQAFRDATPTERVWAFTVRDDRRYVLAAQGRIARVSHTPKASHYGRYRMESVPGSTVWYDTSRGADAEPVLRGLGLKIAAGSLGRSFQGAAAVKELSETADKKLEGFAVRLPALRPKTSSKVGPTKDAVLNAIAEYDKLGQKAFLKKYGYWKAKEYVLLYQGKRYDSKAIYGVARGWEPRDFSGGDLTVRPWLEELGFRVERIPGAARAAALVLTTQEETSGGEYDFWEDETGIQYHYPNKYRNLVQTGLPFVYYRGVRREGGKRGQPEYFGVGRISDIWADERSGAQRHWYCSIEDYREFPTAVPWKAEGKTLEAIKQNQFRDGVRHLPLEVFERICGLAHVGVPTPPKLPDLPDVDDVVLKPAVSGSLLLTPVISETGSSTGPTKRPARRTRHSKIYGDHAELLVKRELEKRGKKGIRHLAADGETMGYDLEYKEGSRTIAVEVKGTTGRAFRSFELTEGEIRAAGRMGADFEIWLVSELRSLTPSFEVISDPHTLLNDTWSKSPLLWRIQRRT